jgi:hypothetical protein
LVPKFIFFIHLKKKCVEYGAEVPFAIDGFSDVHVG